MEFEAKLLDHGYLRFIEHWGSDERIIEAARMSTDKGFLGWDHRPDCAVNSIDFGDIVMPDCTCDGHGDEKLLAYLYENRHDTPFEMAGMVIEVQAPIMVFREWHRHRTQSYNELSARYTPLPDLNYVPSVERLMLNSDGKNRQAGTVKDAAILTDMTVSCFRADLHKMYKQQQELYEWALENGVPKELARVHLPVGRYSRMRASANLRNWLAFMTLRSSEKAQWEIRQYSLSIGKLVSKLYPRTWKLFSEVRR